MKTLTVFTPAYNRAHTISRTYESLLRQTCKDFEWLVIDDGSTDNTRELIEAWIKDNRIPIRYIYQENQGMHGAHNTAYKNIHTELNTCIDSDDFMPDDAVEKIVNFWNSLSEEERQKYAGIIGLDQTEEGKIIGKGFSSNQKAVTLQGYYAEGGSGDKKMVYRTNIINKYPEYPIFEGERYVGLSYKYMLIDQDYELLVLDEPLVTVEYQLDGSSYNMYKQYWRNPKGFSFLRKTEMVCAPKLKRRFISSVHYVATSLISKDRKFLASSPKKLLTFIAIPFGIIWYYRIKSKVKSNALMQMS